MSTWFPCSIIKRARKLNNSNRRRRQPRRLLWEQLEDRRLLAVFTVDNLGDSGPGSLRQAVIDANTTANDILGPDQIVFDAALPAGTIFLTSGELLIDDSVTIDGPGAGQLTIDAGGNSRIFNVEEGPEEFLEVSISGLTLTGGSADDGGAIRNSLGTLYLDSSVLTGNSATRGGAIYTEGDGFFDGYGGVLATLIVDDTEISGNSAEDGGGIFNELDHVELFDSTVNNNTATNNGGGIFTRGFSDDGYGGYGGPATLIVEDTTISGNAADNGGGIYNEDDSVTLTRSFLTSNTATNNGGGVFTFSTDPFDGGESFNARSSEITGNSALLGGGIYTENDFVSIGRDFSTNPDGPGSLVDGNTAVQGGGIYAINTLPGIFFAVGVVDSTFSNNTATGSTGPLDLPAWGGGISNLGAEIDIIRSTFTANRALGANGTGAEDGANAWGGAIYQGIGGGSGGAFIRDSTFSNNVAQGGNSDTGLGGDGYGGGFYTDADFFAVDDSTLAGNVANGGTGGAGDGEGEGGGAWTSNSLNLSNVTLSGNSTNGGGGGVYVGAAPPSSNVELRHVTATANTAADGGGLFHDSTSTIRLLNSLLAGNAGTNPDVSGTVDATSTGNLIGDATGLVGISDGVNGNQVGVANPGLGPLADNAGPTETHALLPGSPAIDAGNNSFGTFFDQRGFRRFGTDDVGAYEVVLDFGDAPSPFPVLLGNDGARHVAGGLVLGSVIDSEADGQPSTAGFANRDDTTGFPDDEDGVTFSGAAAGFMARVDVIASGDGFVNAWMDTNLNGTWDPSEQILTDAAVTAGVNTLFYTIPAIPAGQGDFIAITRFRLNSTGGLSPTGPAADGEVEDYGVLVQEVVLPDGTSGDGFTFTETVQPRVRRPYDPPVAGGYDYTVVGVGSPNAFATVELPVLGFGDESYELSYEAPGLGTVTTTLDAGIEFDFELGGGPGVPGVPGGVDSFRVLGIEIPPGLDPSDPLAFPTFLSFVSAGDITLTLTPLVTPEAVDDDYSVNEDDTLEILATGVLGNDTDFNGDPLTAVLVTGPSDGTLDFMSDGSFTYTPDPDFNGTDSFTYVANDGLFDSTTPAAVTITVNPVNDVPSFTIAADPPASDQDTGLQTVLAFATDISPGPPNEAGQLLTFIVDVDLTTGGLSFATAPAIDAITGDLTYEAAAGTSGTATVSAVLMDDGGTDNGGENTSDPQTFTITVNPVVDDFSFVDANNNKVFDVGTDVALIAGEVEDGFFDTRIPEGGYTTKIKGAGLVINGAGIAGHDLTYRADGDLVVNTDLTADDDIRLTSRHGDVSLDDPTLTAADDISIGARHDIVSSADALTVTGRRSDISLKAFGEIILLDTDLSAGRNIHLRSWRIDVTGSTLTAGRDLNLEASQDAVATAAILTAGKDVELRSWWRGDINVDGATIEAGREIELSARRGDISADISLLRAVREVELEAWSGRISSRGSLLSALGHYGDVELRARVIDIGASPTPTVLEATRKVELKARDTIFADGAFLHACRGTVEVEARNDIHMNDTVVRAFHDIEIESRRGDVSLEGADLAIVDGSTRGDIEAEGDTLFIDGATFTAPDKIKLKGTREGTATFVDGTKPCP